MKTLNKKGFTLIELLAVIVVLAIVTVIATQSVIPFMANAGRDTFVTEANNAIIAASDAMSLMNIGSIPSDKYTKESNNVYCFTLQNLKDLGLWKKDDDNYAGTITVTVSGSTYTYATEMYNKDYYVETTSGSIKTEDKSDTETNGVGDATDSIKSSLKTACVAG